MWAGTCRSLVAADLHALLVVARRGVVGVDDSVGGHAVGVVRLSPGVDGVDVCRSAVRNAYNS